MGFGLTRTGPTHRAEPTRAGRGSVQIILSIPSRENPIGEMIRVRWRGAMHANRVGIAGLNQSQGLILLGHFGEGRRDRLWRQLGISASSAVLLFGYGDAASGDREGWERSAGDVVDPLGQPVENRHYFAKRLGQRRLFNALVSEHFCKRCLRYFIRFQYAASALRLRITHYAAIGDG